MPAVCDGDGDEAEVEEEDVPDTKRADHVEGTSRPRGDTQPIPVTTTLRNGGTSAWVDIVGLDSGDWAWYGLRCVVAVCGLCSRGEAGRLATHSVDVASTIGVGAERCAKAPKFGAKIHSSNSFLH